MLIIRLHHAATPTYWVILEHQLQIVCQMPLSRYCSWYT